MIEKALQILEFNSSNLKSSANLSVCTRRVKITEFMIKIVNNLLINNYDGDTL